MEKLTKTILYIDPAGGGSSGDETAYTVLGLLNSSIFVLAWGGIKGGYEESKMTELAVIAKNYAVDKVYIEKNYGNGALAAVFRPILHRLYPECAIEETMVSGQKEKRILDVLGPIIGRSALVFVNSILSTEESSIAHYPQEKRSQYSGFYQMTHLSDVKDCLPHDDRIDVLAGGCAVLVSGLTIDPFKKTAIDVRKEQEAEMLQVFGIKNEKNFKSTLEQIQTFNIFNMR